MAMTDLSVLSISLILVGGQVYKGNHLIEAAIISGEMLTIVADRACDDDKLCGRLASLGMKQCFPRQKGLKGKPLNPRLYRAR
jgi:hypothetical protein